MSFKNLILNTVLSATTALLIFGCKKNDEVVTSTDMDESVQQIGDMMASVDEAGKGNAVIAFDESLQNSAQQTFARYAPASSSGVITRLLNLPQAQAVSCSGTTYNCSVGTVTRDFAGCTYGAVAFTGTSTLTWSNASPTCNMTSIGDTITHVPDITATGLRGATLTIKGSGSVGQRLTWTAGSGATRTLSFTSDGIRRVFTAGGSTLFDMTSATTSAITITGTDRSSRVMTGGALNVVNNISSVSCSFVPANVTWSSSTCNCPVSGTWTGTCSDSKSTTISITGCGSGTYTDGTNTVGVNFYRCGS